MSVTTGASSVRSASSSGVTQSKNCSTGSAGSCRTGGSGGVVGSGRSVGSGEAVAATSIVDRTGDNSRGLIAIEDRTGDTSCEAIPGEDSGVGSGSKRVVFSDASGVLLVRVAESAKPVIRAAPALVAQQCSQPSRWQPIQREA